MSDMDDKLRAAYRGLPREEPGAGVDAAILAASRRALAKPSASRRWAAPVSIAAVLVLAFGVTLRMQLEKPGVESVQTTSVPPPEAKVAASPTVVPEAPPRAAEAPAAKPIAPVPQKKIMPAAKPDVVVAQAPAPQEQDRVSRDESRAAANERKDLAALSKEANVGVTTSTLQAAPAAPPAPAAAAAAPAPMAAARMKREAFADAKTLAPADEAVRELEAIAKLRADGRDDEAARALAEFRRKRPHYRIPDEMWERVKPR